MPDAPQFPLHDAAALGGTDALTRLLSAGAEVDARDDTGGTALMLAAEAGQTDTVSLLLARGARPDVSDNFGATALMLAAHQGHADIVRQLLASGANVHARNKEGQTALDVATRRDGGKIRQLLTHAGAKVGIVEAALLGDQERVTGFLTAATAVDERNKAGLTPLMAAASKGNVELAVALHEHGADLSVRDFNGDTAFHHAARSACRRNDTVLLSLMLDWGADINAAGSHGSVPLHDALLGASEPVLRFLLERGSDPNAVADRFGRTLLQTAVHCCRESFAPIDLLLAYGAEIEAVDSLGLTALIHAVKLRPEKDDPKFERAVAAIRNVAYVKRDAQHRLELVRHLIEKGAYVNAGSERGSVISHAAEFGDAALIRLLLDAGADINGSCGPSPRTRALLFGNSEVVQILRARGAEECATDDTDPKIREAVAYALGGKPHRFSFRGNLVDRINEALRRKKDR